MPSLPSELSPRAFVAGATGYTGRAVVEVLRSRGVETVAHVRPGSSRRDEWRARFEALGAAVDLSPWELEPLRESLERLGPTLVFSLLGTTAKRARGEGMQAEEAYEKVDYGLSKLLLDACLGLVPLPRFVYLSSLGADGSLRNPYLEARARMEADLRRSGLPFVIARPSFITGPDRDEERPLEQIGAKVGDALLGVAGVLGARRLRDRYASTDASGLARALVRL
ncbi:MAG TPA: epimerase, partial [Planctomycetes bacterium]|nr:epimerase [Planctomycetota bacterium]